MAKYLNSDGLAYLWNKIKAAIPTKTSQLTNDSGYKKVEVVTALPATPDIDTLYLISES